MTAPPIDQATLDTAVALAARGRRAHAAVVPRRRPRGRAQGRRHAGHRRRPDAERFLREQLAEAFPGDGVLGEEEAPTAGTTGRRWILDPIDGTKAFTCGVPLYSNLLALEDEHGIAVGVDQPPGPRRDGVGRPRARVLLRAGPGARQRPRHARRRLRDVELAQPLARRARRRALDAAGAVLRTWGDGYGYALVATGRAAAMVDPIVEPYDVGPMPVILAEAGGRFTDLAGERRASRAAAAWPATASSTTSCSTLLRA